MRDFKVARRMARAGLFDAFTRAGIPADYLTLPHQDDHIQLLVVSDSEVRWVDDRQIYRKAEIYIEGDGGFVCGEDMYRISDSRDFFPDDYGFHRPFTFELPFDLTDIAEAERDAWESLPLAKLPKRPPPFVPRYISRRNPK